MMKRLTLAAYILGLSLLVAVGFLAERKLGAVPKPVYDVAFDLTKEKGEGILVLIDERTGKIVPDFQDSATPGTLIGNAVRAGKGKPDDFREVRISKDDYRAYTKIYTDMHDAYRKTLKAQEVTATTTP